ncbi:hypothetical protein MTR_3g115410 [Medicago truncatula]|uniref:Uncharacterized protein n=1 Tax=Medicago truncatula TaxID=3880 RepID=A0A072V3B4_MEDTR|nr:hypothetical protein MTR_3g115410 [Medicago truncatula]
MTKGFKVFETLAFEVEIHNGFHLFERMVVGAESLVGRKESIAKRKAQSLKVSINGHIDDNDESDVGIESIGEGRRQERAAATERAATTENFV